jgi:hypothetical protein
MSFQPNEGQNVEGSTTKIGPGDPVLDERKFQ